MVEKRPAGCKLNEHIFINDSPISRRGPTCPRMFPAGIPIKLSPMSATKRTKKRTKLRRFLKTVLWTAGGIVLLSLFLFIAALLTVDRWVVPFGAWCTGVEVEGEPEVIVSLSRREIILTGLKVKMRDGRFEAKSCGWRFDGVKLAGLSLKEVRVSDVHAEGLRMELDFSRVAGVSPSEEDGSLISGEKFRNFSHLLWNKASKPVVRMMDLTLLDAEVGWLSGVAGSVVSISDLNATFEDGRLTRPQIVCGVKYALNEPWRTIQFGGRLKASAARGSESIIISAAGNTPLVIELPDSRMEFPVLASTDMVVQYEPETDSLRFGGEWTNSDRWEYAPLNLSMDNTLLEVFGTLALEGEKLHLRCGASGQVSDLICRGGSIPGEAVFEAKCNMEYDLASGGVTLDDLSGHLTGPKGGRIDLETSGVFEFMRHEDATYTLNPQAASLLLSTAKPIDLTPFDPVLPFDASGRELSGDYHIELDPEKECLNGGASVSVTDRNTMSREFEADAVFETDGVNRIGSFHVSHCGMSFYDGDDQICGALFTGEYNIRTASLKGGLRYNPYRMIEKYGDQGVADFCVFLDDANLCDLEHSASAELDFDLANMTAKLHKESRLSHLALTGTDGKNLELDAIGDAEFRLEPDGRGWQLECALELNAGRDFHALLNASGGTETAIAGHVEISRLGDDLARQMERKFFPGRDDMPVLRFLNASASADFRYEPDASRAVLTNLDAVLDNGEGQAEIHSKSEFAWVDGVFRRAPADFKLKTASLPVSFWEPLLDSEAAVRPAGGVLTSELDFSLSEDGTILDGEGKLVGKDLTILFSGKPCEMARVGANGSFLFNLEKKFLLLPEVNVDIQDRKARQMLFASGSGTVNLADECRTSMRFPEVRFGPEILYLIGYGVERSFYFEDLDSGGEITFKAEHNFKEMGWDGSLGINRLRLQSDEPDEYRFPELSGRIEGGLLWADSELFGDVTIRLADENDEEHFSGRYLYRRGEGAPPKFVSSSLDLPFAVSYFRYNHNTDPEIETSAISLFDKTIELDLHGIYARNHSMIFSSTGMMELRDGDDPSILVPRAEFSGDVSGTASAEIHVKDGTWPFEVKADLKDIPFNKSFAAFLATDDSPDIPHGLHGFIKRLQADVRGEGFTTEALTRNLQADCRAELEGVSLRSSLRDRSFFLNILLMPLISVPRLIDYVPGEMVRRALRLATAGAIMDMISGETPMEFNRGMMELSLRKGVVELKEFILEGDLLEEYTARGTIDLAGEGGADLETNTKFAFFFWPFYLTGDILDPKVSYGKSISHFFTDNAKYLLVLFPNMIISAFTEDDAEEIDRLESEQQEAGRQQEQEEKK